MGAQRPIARARWPVCDIEYVHNPSRTNIPASCSGTKPTDVVEKSGISAGVWTGEAAAAAETA